MDMSDEDSVSRTSELEVSGDEAGVASGSCAGRDATDSEGGLASRLEAAAFQLNLPFAELSDGEAAHFPDICSGSAAGRRAYLLLRNRLLLAWFDNPLKQLTLNFAVQSLELISDSDKQLCHRALIYLERHGYVNFGVYEQVEQPLTMLTKADKRLSVIILGAGIAGLAAARQLQAFGCQVTVLEARDRIGGRISTFRRGAYVADLGAMVITGLGGNPLTICSKQVDIELFKLKTKCPLFDDSGSLIDAERDAVIEREFNRLLEAAAYLSHEKRVEEAPHCSQLSLGQAVDLLVQMQEQRCREHQLVHLQKMLDLQDNLAKILKEMEVAKEEIKRRHDAWMEQESGQQDSGSFMQLFDRRSKQRDLSQALLEFQRLKVKGEELQDSLDALDAEPPSGLYLSPSDLHLLNWHKANLEFANAARLDQLSLRHWDQDDENEFSGPHLTVRNGYSCLPVAMAEGITDLRLETVVNKVQLTEEGVTVNARSAGQEDVTITADVAICTLPLGVLKQQHKSIFEPALPQWKSESIDKLGFGVLNKVLLAFDKYFWDPQLNLFGYVPNSVSGRGEFFLFWSVYKAPVLLALVSGEAAELMELASDEAVVERAMSVLRKIFNNVPTPKHTAVTRWRSDPFSCGSYSYVATGATGDDYDTLAKPVSQSDSGQVKPRLLFAGEHTNRQYPATVHGALLSGLREAGRVCDLYATEFV